MTDKEKDTPVEEEKETPPEEVQKEEAPKQGTKYDGGAIPK